MWFFNQQNCINNKDIMNDAIRVFNLFLNNEYITSDTKNHICLYLYQINQISQINQIKQCKHFKLIKIIKKKKNQTNQINQTKP